MRRAEASRPANGRGVSLGSSAANESPTRPRWWRADAATVGGTALVAAAVFLVAVDGGSYSLASRDTLAILVWWTLVAGVGTGVFPREAIPFRARAALALLAGLALVTALSLLWASDAERAFNELGRVLLYLGVFAIAIVASRSGAAARWTAGVAIGIVAVGLLALASRLFPQLFPAHDVPRFLPSERARLSYPVDYWNGLATLIALGTPLLLAAATSARGAVGRFLAVAPLPALAAAVYLTSSRGGTISTVLAALVFLVLTGERLRAALAVGVAAAGSVAAVAVVSSRPAVLQATVETSGRGQGRSAAVMLALICVGAGLAFAALARLTPVSIALPQIPRWGRVFAAVLAIVLVAAMAAAANPAERFERFKEPSTGPGEPSVQAHITSASGNGRWQWWTAAVDEWRSSPWIGRGAGSYEAWWLERGTLAGFVRDAHSLYLETLAELGIVGGLLLIGFLIAAVSGLPRLLRESRGADRIVVASLAGAVAAYVFEAGIDWMWEMTVVSIVAFLVLGLLAGPAVETRPSFGASPRRRRRTLALRVGAIIFGVAAIVVAAVPLLAQTHIENSQAAVRRGDFTDALSAARAGRDVQPWASSPWVQLALVQEAAGDLRSAASSIHEATERAPSDWRVWLVTARIQTKLGNVEQARTSLARARELNPRSPLFADQ